MTLLWLPLTLCASALLIARNAAQRSLSDTAGPWGATLARFLFGLPFAILFLGLVWMFAPPVAAHLSPGVIGAAALGGAAQICATAALLQAMRASSFGLGMAFQHLGLPLAALFGALFLGDKLGWTGWLGIGAASLGLLVVSWPARNADTSAAGDARRAAAFGLVSGLCFAISGNCYRYCGLHLDPGRIVFSSAATLVLVQAMQTAALGGLLAILDRRALRALRADLATSSIAGAAGAASSFLWFWALALVPAAWARAVAALVETPFGMLAGRLRFGEALETRRVVGAALMVAGVLIGLAPDLIGASGAGGGR